MNDDQIIGLYRDEFSGLLGRLKSVSPVCAAPFRNLYFGRNGEIFACCFNRLQLLGTYPERSINEVLKASPLSRLRQLSAEGRLFSEGLKNQSDEERSTRLMLAEMEALDTMPGALLHSEILGNALRSEMSADLENYRLFHGCHVCWDNIKSGNIASSGPSVYAAELSSAYPETMEFELDNTCNLACVMCSAKFSSSIESQINLPVRSSKRNPYDEAFVSDIEPYFQSLKKANFYGGDPYLISLYYKIWERIISLNPDCVLYVQSNGTILNDRIKTLLKNGNFSVGLSIDSLDKNSFQLIRKNAGFSTVMKNLSWLISYHNQKGAETRVAVCAMQQNAREIPELLKRFSEMGVFVNFNTVISPQNCSFSGMTFDALQALHHFYLLQDAVWNGAAGKHNSAAFKDLCSQISHLAAKKEQEEQADLSKHSNNSRVQIKVDSFQKKAFSIRKIILDENREAPVLLDKLKNEMRQRILQKRIVTENEAAVRAHIITTETESWLNKMKSSLVCEEILKQIQKVSSPELFFITEILSGRSDKHYGDLMKTEINSILPVFREPISVILYALKKAALKRRKFNEDDVLKREEIIFEKFTEVLKRMPEGFPVARLIRSLKTQSQLDDMLLQYELRHPSGFWRIFDFDIPAGTDILDDIPE